MRHFLITRYYTGDFRKWNPNQKGYLKVDDEWIERRHELFQKFTHPSVMAQTTTDFTWLVLCSDYMKKWDMSWMESQNVRVLYGFNKYFKNNSIALAPVIDALLLPSDDAVITTRLDSDDAISTNFMNRSRAMAEEGSVTTWERGYRLYKGQVYEAFNLKNHFISFAETRHSARRTVYEKSHQAMVNHYPTVVEHDDHGWLEVIHERNAKNTAESLGLLDKEPRWEWDQVRRKFGL